MTGIDALPIIAGFLTIWLAAWVNKPDTRPSVKRAVSIGIAVVLGGLSLIISGQIAEFPSDAVAWVDKIVGYVGLAIVASQGFYQALWDKVKRVEGDVPSETPAEPGT